MEICEGNQGNMPPLRITSLKILQEDIMPFTTSAMHDVVVVRVGVLNYVIIDGWDGTNTDLHPWHMEGDA